MDILNEEFAEKNKSIFEIAPGIFMNIVPYDFLLRMKLLSRRPKDYLDVTELNKLRTIT